MPRRNRRRKERYSDYHKKDRRKEKIPICPKCLHRVANSHHHIFPRRHFGDGLENNNTIFLCRICHIEIEWLIPLEKQRRKVYLDILRMFFSIDVMWLVNQIKNEEKKRAPS
ncbi:MAG: hypothetical protein HY228_01490 [Candidatus Yonathbacteria bacterium]|nr:hypothetical protein [Candidatus Yonathbacteria bacterium]